MALNGIEEYSLRSITTLGGNMHSQITVGNVTLPKAVLKTVKIFAVYKALNLTSEITIIYTDVNQSLTKVGSGDNLVHRTAVVQLYPLVD